MDRLPWRRKAPINAADSLPRPQGPAGVRSKKMTRRQRRKLIPHAVCRICGSSNVELFCTAFDRTLKTTEETWQILRCRGCGFGWTFPQPPADRIASYYPPSYLGNVERTLEDFLSGRLLRSRSWRGETEKVRLLERRARGGRVLDVGCGAGQFLWALDPRRWQRTGVDFSGDTLESVRRRIPSLRLVAGDIHSRELHEGEFDAVTFWHVLEHLPDPDAAIRRAAALLRPSGWLVISLPNVASLQARLFRKYWYPFDDVPRHLYHFSGMSLDLLLGRAGLAVREHLLFSPLVNFHSLKHSLIHWSEGLFHSRLPYYVLKPLLLLAPPLERLAHSYGILTVVSHKA